MYGVTILPRGLPGIGPPAERTALVTLLLSMKLAWTRTSDETHEHYVQKAPEVAGTETAAREMKRQEKQRAKAERREQKRVAKRAAKEAQATLPPGTDSSLHSRTNNCRCRGRWNGGLPFLQEAKREKAF